MTAFAINNLSKNYGPRTLFEPASIQFALGSCYGIVGANGSGKSTMLKIMAGTEEASDGEVNIPRKMRVGVLGQDQFEYDAVPILDVVLMGQPELWAAMVERREILENADESFDADRYGELEDIFQLYDGYSVEARAAEILEGLGIPTDVHDQPMRALSGGYRIRALMARTLAAEPDILLLDEPTNHLDIISIQWLERFLRGFKGCTVVVSHDRDFLNTVCTHIIDIDYQLATLYKGNYTQFEHLLAEDRSRRESQIEKREKEIKSHKAWIDKVKAKPSKARQAQSKVKQMLRIVIEHLPESSRRHPRFNIKQNRPSGKQVVEAAGIEKSYGEKQVLHGIDLRVQRGDRLAIVGPNGIGKSTLLGILTGTNEADDGVFEWGYQTHVGNFSQDHRELAGHDEATIIDWLWTMHSTLGPGQVRGKLAEVLFGKDEIDKKVGHLSGGERTRLIFSHLSTAKPNVLVLDEPTNHLDIEGIEALADGIEAFDGTTIFVSHDRWFVSRLATRILALTPQGARDFQGTWSEYLARFGDDYLDGEAQARKNKKKSKKKKKKSK